MACVDVVCEIDEVEVEELIDGDAEQEINAAIRTAAALTAPDILIYLLRLCFVWLI
jgi:hypothetical protein